MIEKQKILLVEGESATREKIAQRLEKGGHTVIQAANKAAAINKLDSGIDLLISSLYIPNGSESTPDSESTQDIKNGFAVLDVAVGKGMPAIVISEQAPTVISALYKKPLPANFHVSPHQPDHVLQAVSDLYNGGTRHNSSLRSS